MNVLVVDNYDSFTYNLVQYLGELGAEPEVHRNDAITLAQIRRKKPEREYEETLNKARAVLRAVALARGAGGEPPRPAGGEE